MNRHPSKKTRKTARAVPAPTADEIAKQRAASQKAQKEWGGLQMSVPESELEDRGWYYGDDGVNCVGLWDARAGCFWTIEFGGRSSRTSDPPKESGPKLKRERYGSTPKKGFMPIAVLERAG